MSLDALRWALKSQPGNSSRKMVLISLADRANEEHECFPGTERLEQDTCLNIKTVKKCLHELADLGLIEDTGKRLGKTGRVKVWRLLGVAGREDDSAQSTQNRNDSKNGPIKSAQKRNDTKNGINPILPPNQPKNGTTKSTQNWDAEPPSNLTTQSNHPDSCSDLAAATSSPPENSSAEGELVDQDEDTIVPGWTFAQLIDPAEQDPEAGTFIALPLRSDQSPPVHFVTDRDVINLQETYRGIDVPDQCRLMLGWLVGNPGKRKTAAGIRKFISGWLSRAKAGGGTPYDQAAPHLTGYDKQTVSDPKAKRAQVREALRDIRNTDW